MVETAFCAISLTLVLRSKSRLSWLNLLLAHHSREASCNVPRCGPRRRCARRSWEIQRRICRPGSTHACAGAAMMRTLCFRALFRTAEAGPDALRQNPAKTFYGHCRVFSDWLRQCRFRPSLRCIDGVSMSLLRSYRLSLSASCAVLTPFSPRQSLEQSRHCFSCLRPTFQSRSISTRHT